MNKITLKDIIFVINPHSGTNSDKILKNLLEVVPEIDYFISQTLEDFDVFLTAKLKNYKVLVICGGDGTINTSLKYVLENPKISLAIFPNGSGNGFARELGFGNNVKELLDSIYRGETKDVDIFKVNQDFSCNMLGLGFDSYVAAEFEKQPTRGLKTYVYCTLKAILKYHSINVKIDIDGSLIEGQYHMINVANTRQFGNNALIAPEALYDDGKMDLVLIKNIPFYKMPAFVVNLFLGKLKNSKYVQFVKASNLIIDSNSETYHIDGEPKKMTKSLHIEVFKQIRVVNTKGDNL